MGRRSSSSSSRSRMVWKNPFGMPRIKGSSTCARKTNFSFFDRFRDTVLRLIMLSALSKASATVTPENKPHNAHRSSTYNYHESHRSEAVADCIEFIKKSAAAATDVEICAEVR